MNQSPLDPLVEAIAEAVVRKLAGHLPGQGTDQKLLSIKDAAAYLGRTPSSVRGMIYSGEIPDTAVKRFNKRIFLLKRELDAWVNAQ